MTVVLDISALKDLQLQIHHQVHMSWVAKLMENVLKVTTVSLELILQLHVLLEHTIH